MMKSTSTKHRNRAAHNWLAYDLTDRDLFSKTNLYQGVLYDLGAGEAPYREFFVRFVRQYVTVDWGESPHNSSPDIVADLNEPLPIADGAADTVVSISVLEHLYKPKEMIQEVARILRPGGWFILQVPWQWWIHEAPYDYFRYTPYAIQKLLEDERFECIETMPQAGFFSMLTLKLNYFSMRFLPSRALFRLPVLAVLSVLWYVGQKLAPILDRLDHDWELEATGYFVVAKKPAIESRDAS